MLKRGGGGALEGTVEPARANETTANGVGAQGRRGLGRRPGSQARFQTNTAVIRGEKGKKFGGTFPKSPPPPTPSPPSPFQDMPCRL